MSGKNEEDRSLAEKLEELHRKIAELEAAKRVRDASREELLRTRRALVTLSECSRVLVRATREHLLLDEVCRVIVEEGGYRMAWVGYAEKDEAKTVSPVAYMGFEEGYLENLNVTWTDTERGRGPTGTAIRTGRIYVAQDILTDPGFAPWRSEARRRGYESSIALPLAEEGEVFGSINIYAAEPDAFDEREVELLSGLAEELSYGITSLRARAVGKRAERELKRAHDELEARVKARTAELVEVNKQLELEVQERRHAEETLKRDREVDSALAELAAALLGEESIDDISYKVLEKAQNLTESEFGFVGYIDPKTGYFVSSTMTGEIWEICQVEGKQAVFKEFTGLWGWVLNNRKPLLTNEPSQDPRSSGIPDGHVPIRRFLSVPALAGEVLVGQIALANPARDYTDDDQEVLRKLADIYALTVQRQRSDEALWKSERKYRRLIGNLPNVVFRGYLDWSVEFLDHKIEELTGFTKDDFNSRRVKWNEVILEEDLGYVREVFIEALKERRPYVREYRIRTKAGETIWLQEWSQIVFDEEGEVEFVTGTFMDVSSRRRAEDNMRVALAQSRQREVEVSALLHGSRSVLEHREFEDAARSIFDSAKEITGAKAGYVALLSEDGSENEIVFLDSGGLPCTVDPDQPMPIRGLREEAYNTGEVVYDNAFLSSEHMEFMPEGHVNLDNVLFAPMVIRGRVEGLLGLANNPEGFTDNDARMALAFSELAAIALANSRALEERNRARTALQEAHDELEKRVQERTGELVEAQVDLMNALAEVENLKRRLEMENIYLQEEIKVNHNFEEIIGRSGAMKRVLGNVEQVASTDATVLILGETGTGKELFARAIHNLSPRNHRPLVKVNCAALQQTLIESELFGHEKGAFTGAFSQRVGRFELADSGTIFLDEIGDLSPELQSKLLRVIQEGELERLGGSRTIKVDVRLIAATHRNLEAEVKAGQFREDLYYRLNVFPISIPPLRERREDISLLVRHFSQKYAAALGKRIDNIPQKVLEVLKTYPWSGNVRELENVIERAVIIARSSTLKLQDFREILGEVRPGEADLSTLDDAQRDHIIRALKRTEWRIEGKRGAAALLGINPSTLRSRMRKLGIKRPRGMG